MNRPYSIDRWKRFTLYLKYSNYYHWPKEQAIAFFDTFRRVEWEYIHDIKAIRRKYQRVEKMTRIKKVRAL